MSQQPEALKHAEWLERSLTIGAPEAAAELRRLHAVELEAISLRAQVERLQAACHSQNAESYPQAGLSLTGATQEAADTGAPSLDAASAMVRMTTKQRADALDAAIFGCPTVAVVAAFSKGITAAEKFHGIGLTVGGKASGRVGK